MLSIKNICVKINSGAEEKEILKNVNLELAKNKVYALMGPNGSGKSTLAQTLMGHPNYEVTSGTVVFEKNNLFEMEPNERALAGLFLSFQYPSEVTGVTISGFLRMVYNKRHTSNLSPVAFRKILKEKMELLEMKEDFMSRYLNEGFSGGEKKRMEMLQMLIIEPKLAILDETDSGLDVDALKIVGKAVNYLREKSKTTILIITHYTRILKHIIPDVVFIMQNGQITRTGGKDLARELEEKGYAPFGDQ